MNLPLSQLVTGEVFDGLPALLSALLGLGAAAARLKWAIVLCLETSQMQQNKAAKRKRL